MPLGIAMVCTPGAGGWKLPTGIGLSWRLQVAVFVSITKSVVLVWPGSGTCEASIEIEVITSALPAGGVAIRPQVPLPGTVSLWKRLVGSALLAVTLPDAATERAPAVLTLARFTPPGSVMETFVNDTAHAPTGSSTAATTAQMIVVRCRPLNGPHVLTLAFIVHPSLFRCTDVPPG